MAQYIDTINLGLVFILLLGIAVYAVMLLFYVLPFLPGHGHISKLLGPKPAYTFGLPISAIVAFGIVAVLNLSTGGVNAATSSQNIPDATVQQAEGKEQPKKPKKPDDEPTGKLDFEAFNLKFRGPASPVTLWVVVHLAIVASMRIVAPRSNSGADPKHGGIKSPENGHKGSTNASSE